jgi:putative drug exporter of the RND superfamily
MLEQLADWCYRRRRLVVTGWLVALVMSSAAAAAWGGEFRQDYLQPGSESRTASGVLADRFPDRAGDSVQIVFHADDGVGSPGVRPRVERVLAEVAGSGQVVSVQGPFDRGGTGQVSVDGGTAYADVIVDRTATELTAAEANAIVEPVLAAGDDALRIEAGGPVAALSQTAPVGSEGIGLLAAALILLVVFGSAVAMGLPIITALFGLGVAVAVVELMKRVVDVPDWAPATAAMVGIGVGIDYALLVVTRFRSSLADGENPRDATRSAIGTAGRAVLFAGLTVVASMLGILLMGQPSMTGFALTVAPTVLLVVLATLTLLPAVLGFAGRSIERWHVPFLTKGSRPPESSRWYRWSRVVQRRPWVSAVGATVALLALAAPVVGLRFGVPDARSDPAAASTRQAYDLLADGFGPGFAAPLVLTVEGRPGQDLHASADRLAEDVGAVSGVADVRPAAVNPAADTAVLTVVPATAPQDPATEDLVDRLRDSSIPAATEGTGLTVHVGGAVAANLDSTRGTADRLPLFFGGVLLVSFMLLMMVFRSLVVPLKAVAMNVLASAAAFGVLALAVNGGPLGDLVGIPEATPVPIQLPIGIFAILFGLSLDYEVFLLSRIKEEYVRTGDNALAVADGLAKSARVITAGAAVMVTVFASFILGGAVLGKMFGIGLAAAVLVDATLVRMVLVPATMELLGDRNWWLPGWLDRLLPAIRVEGRRAQGPGTHLADSFARPRTPSDLRTTSSV